MLEYHILDVFSDHAYAGNPLAIVLAADALTCAQMQQIAREFTISETIFVLQPKNPAHSAKVRIFHPKGELPFAGHPTIGCAILLAEMANTGDFSTVITLEETAGLVPVKVQRSKNIISAEFVAPIIPKAFPAAPLSPEMAAAALSLPAEDIGFDRHQINNLQAGPNFVFVPVASRAALKRASVTNPAFQAFTKAAKNDSVYVYCRDGDGFSSRMFAPAHGMPEDPATGSASAILAAQLLAAGELSQGSNKYILKQGEDMGRPSLIKLAIELNGTEISEIRIKGSAARFAQGTITNQPLETEQ